MFCSSLELNLRTQIDCRSLKSNALQFESFFPSLSLSSILSQNISSQHFSRGCLVGETNQSKCQSAVTFPCRQNHCLMSISENKDKKKNHNGQ